jgi:hypothetical protein
MIPPASLTALMPTDPSEFGAGKNDGEVVAPLRGERAKEKIDWRPLPARFVKLGDRQMMIGRAQLPVGGNDIDVARLKGSEASHLRHRHARPRS